MYRSFCPSAAWFFDCLPNPLLKVSTQIVHPIPRVLTVSDGVVEKNGGGEHIDEKH
jgi:hypothetical protein